MSMIAEVARLKDLEEKATPEPWKYRPSGISDCGNDYPDCIYSKEGGLFYDVCDEPETHLIIALRNVAPVMLDILGHIQPVDDYLIGEIFKAFDIFTDNVNFTEEENNELKRAKDCLMRLQAMCQKMEEP